MGPLEPLYKGQVGGGSLDPWREVVFFSEVMNEHVVLCSEVVLFSESPLWEVPLETDSNSQCEGRLLGNIPSWNTHQVANTSLSR